jgi:hypothetical protein
MLGIELILLFFAVPNVPFLCDCSMQGPFLLYGMYGIEL